MRHLLTLLIFIVSTTTVNASDLKIELTDLRNSEGNIAISLHDNEETFKGNNAENIAYTMIINAAGPKAVTLHDFPSGAYAISILHDEDKDNVLDTNERDFPTEGYAYSNNVGKISVPSFKKASFIHTNDADTTQTIKMLYIK